MCVCVRRTQPHSQNSFWLVYQNNMFFDINKHKIGQALIYIYKLPEFENGEFNFEGFGEAGGSNSSNNE